MNKFEYFIEKINFKKATSTYLIISGILLILCLSGIAYVARDKITMVANYQRVAESIKKEGITDPLKNQLKNLAASSKDINNVIILDKDNTILFKANNNLIDDKEKLQLAPYGMRSGYLQDRDNPNMLFKVVKPENMILNKDYIQKEQEVSRSIEDELSSETDFNSKQVLLLNYLIDRSTQNKVLMIRTANPIPNAETLLGLTGAILGLILAFYWIGLALWVYKDAGRKKLNASLWGLLILITNLVGLIVYLIYNQSNLTCHKCGSLQNKGNLFCSFCGTEINKACPYCKALISKGDIYCGRCGNKID